MKSTRQKAFDSIFYGLFSLLLLVVTCYIGSAMSLSLWGDELYRLHQMSINFWDLIKPHSFNDPNYPTQIILFKLASLLFQTNDPNILVLINLFNLGLMVFSIYLIKEKLNTDNLIILISLIVASEFFIRIFLEINTYGFILGFSTLFSCLLFKTYFTRDGFLSWKNRNEQNCPISLLISGCLLATIHPISGLFVSSVFFILFLKAFSRTKLKVFSFIKLNFSLITGFFFPILFLYLYGSAQVESHHLQLSINHIVNTGAFIIPILLLGICFLFLGFRKNPKEILEKIIVSFLPILLPLIILFAYSYLVIPTYQARYFMTFLPLTSLITIGLFNEIGVKKIRLPFILACLITVLFLYGPRSQIPYTNYQYLIETSHNENCKDVPLFFNKAEIIKTPLFAYQNMLPKTYLYASNLYSKNFQRELISYDKFIRSIDNLKLSELDCQIIGISGQKEQDVFLKSLDKDINKHSSNSYEVRKIIADKCLKPGCGILWAIKESP
tara:strand:- start:381 stop:1874 length:1494 start_codon:yes stop_codon:yes gene_type:complete